MSVSEKLLRLAEVKASIRTAIIAKGVSVSEADSFADYALRIAAIGGSGGEDPGEDGPYQLFTYDAGSGLTAGATSESMPERPLYAPYGSWRSDFKIEGGQLYVKNENNSSYTLLDSNTGWTDVTGYLDIRPYIGALMGYDDAFPTFCAGILDGKLYTLTRTGVTRVGETTGWTRIIHVFRLQSVTSDGPVFLGHVLAYGIKDGHLYGFFENGIGLIPADLDNCTFIDNSNLPGPLYVFGGLSMNSMVISGGALFKTFEVSESEFSVQQVGTLTTWTRICADLNKGIAGGELKDFGGNQIGTNSDYVDLSPTLYIRGTKLYRWSDDALVDDARPWLAVWGNTAVSGPVPESNKHDIWISTYILNQDENLAGKLAYASGDGLTRVWALNNYQLKYDSDSGKWGLYRDNGGLMSASNETNSPEPVGLTWTGTANGAIMLWDGVKPCVPLTVSNAGNSDANGAYNVYSVDEMGGVTWRNSAYYALSGMSGYWSIGVWQGGTSYTGEGGDDPVSATWSLSYGGSEPIPTVAWAE